MKSNAPRTQARVGTRERLTSKQEAFCLAYLQEPDASSAYRSAYSAMKMKPATINRKAFDLLQDGKITARIAELRAAAARDAVLEESRVLREVARIGLSDPGELFDDDGNLRSIKDLSPEIRACIASIEIDNRTEGHGEDRRFYTVKKIRLWDKNSALEKLMKHLGSFEKDNRQRAGVFDHLPPAEAKAVRDFLTDLSRAASARVKDLTARPTPPSTEGKANS